MMTRQRPFFLFLLHPRKRRNTERGPEAGVRGASPAVVMMMMTTTMIMMIIMTTMMMLFRDLKVASRTSRTALLALQVSAEQSAGWMTAMPSSTNPACYTQIGPKL